MDGIVVMVLPQTDSARFLLDNPSSSKVGHILAIFIYGTSSGPPRLELK